MIAFLIGFLVGTSVAFAAVAWLVRDMNKCITTASRTDRASIRLLLAEMEAQRELANTYMATLSSMVAAARRDSVPPKSPYEIQSSRPGGSHE